jgi:hypothetical protein
MALRILLSATNLMPAQPRVTTKLSLAAVQELISVAESAEVICQSIHETSGGNYPQNYTSKSLPSSQLSSRK